MSVATNQQVQNFSDQRARPACEQFVSLLANLQLILAQMADVNANLTASPPTTWTDSRADFPPHLATPSDLITLGNAVQAFQRVVSGTGTATDSQTIAAAMPVVQSLCVNNPF